MADHVHEPYPRFALDCITEPIRIVRQGKLKEEMPLLAKCAYTLAGAGLAVTIGEPPGVEPLIGDAADASDDQLQECQQAFEKAQSEVEQFGAAPDDANLNPAVVLLVMQLAAELLKLWRERRKQGS